MTAEALLAKAQTWTTPEAPARSKTAYRVFVPTIDYLVTQQWSATAIKARLAKETKLDPKQAERLYHFICRHLRRSQSPPLKVP